MILYERSDIRHQLNLQDLWILYYYTNDNLLCIWHHYIGNKKGQNKEDIITVLVI